MRLARPGSWPWLLGHELRLLWRSLGVRSKVMAALGILLLALTHVAGWVMLRQHMMEEMLARAPATLVLITAFTLFLAVSSAFGLAVRVFFERGDIESLLAAPVPISTIYAVRGITVALASVGSVAVFLLPFANMGPFVGQWEKLGAWPVLGALGLGAAAIAMAGTLALVKAFGFGRARVVAQLAGAILGAALVIVIQAETALPREARRALRERFAADGAWLGSDSPLLWPARAFMGEGVPLLTWVAGALVLFVWTVRGTQQVFLRAVQDAPQVATATRRAARRARPFRSGLARVVLVKELLLVARDPALIAKTLLQLLYLVPLFMVMVQRAQPAELLACGLVVMSAGLAGTLAWITVSGEEAPDLIAAAPVALDRMRWLKVAAALAPVGVIVLPFLAWFASQSWTLAAVAALFVGLALASSGVVQVWATPMGGGRDVRRRYSQNPFVNVADTVSSFCWALACYLALMRSPWVGAAIALGSVAPAAAWFSGRQRRSAGSRKPT